MFHFREFTLIVQIAKHPSPLSMQLSKVMAEESRAVHVAYSYATFVCFIASVTKYNNKTYSIHTTRNKPLQNIDEGIINLIVYCVKYLSQ